MSLKYKEILEYIEKGPYSADWSSLTDWEMPEWFTDAKFGMYIHSLGRVQRTGFCQ